MSIELVLLTLVIVVFAFAIGYMLARAVSAARFQIEIAKIRKDTVKRQRAVVGGQVSEQLAPYFPDFPYKSSEARFIGKPFDFLIFEGMDEKMIRKVVFVEVKTASSRLSSQERNLKETIEAGHVEWFTYRVPDTGDE